MRGSWRESEVLFIPPVAVRILAHGNDIRCLLLGVPTDIPPLLNAPACQDRRGSPWTAAKGLWASARSRLTSTCLVSSANGISESRPVFVSKSRRSFLNAHGSSTIRFSQGVDLLGLVW